ncbi:MAG: class I SAM-dependent methyltransferase [Planctomycetota bacterium]|jgi:ubiquinone/menaquinone biosynthesis C-methylase UbiE
MPELELVTNHYDTPDLLTLIINGLSAMGKSPEGITVDDLASADEFHIGGRGASESFLDQLGIDQPHRVLDVGCGIGGTSRFAADRYGCRVDGIDPTPSFIDTGKVLCAWTGLTSLVTLAQAGGSAMPFPDSSFDAAFMIHVGMNVADKFSVFAEVSRVLKPGCLFGVFDVMKTGDEAMSFPVPWASDEKGSAVDTAEHYKSDLQRAGFVIEHQRDRHAFALSYFESRQQKIEEAGGPPPLGAHLVMGDDAPIKVSNLVANITNRIISPVELIARLP